MEISSAPC